MAPLSTVTFGGYLAASTHGASFLSSSRLCSCLSLFLHRHIAVPSTNGRPHKVRQNKIKLLSREPPFSSHTRAAAQVVARAATSTSEDGTAVGCCLCAPIKIPSGQTPGWLPRVQQPGHRGERENKKEIIKVTNFRSICSDAPLPSPRRACRRKGEIFYFEGITWSSELTDLDFRIRGNWRNWNKVYDTQYFGSWSL